MRTARGAAAQAANPSGGRPIIGARSTCLAARLKGQPPIATLKPPASTLRSMHARRSSPLPRRNLVAPCKDDHSRARHPRRTLATKSAKRRHRLAYSITALARAARSPNQMGTSLTTYTATFPYRHRSANSSRTRRRTWRAPTSAWSCAARRRRRQARNQWGSARR